MSTMCRYFVPAFSDSELGIDFALHKIARQQQSRPVLRFDPFEDFEKIRGYDAGTEAHGDFYGGRRCAAELVAAIWCVCGAAGASSGYKSCH